MTLRSVVIGCGHYLPERILTNSDIEKIVDTTDDWIIERTGIQSRHIAAEGETTSMLATRAAERAIENAGCLASDIDLIVLATATPDYTFPSTATQVQAALGIHSGAAFDVQDGCRQVSDFGLAQKGAGDWRGDVFAHSRLDRPDDVRVVWRWCRSCCS